MIVFRLNPSSSVYMDGRRGYFLRRAGRPGILGGVEIKLLPEEAEELRRLFGQKDDDDR